MNGIHYGENILNLLKIGNLFFEQIQNASNDMQTKFNQVWEKASAESSPETIKDFTELWQKSYD